jgi:hypothetical protein
LIYQIKSNFFFGVGAVFFDAQLADAGVEGGDIDVDDVFALGYSISIPLTDVGREEYLVIDAVGNVLFREPAAGD